MEVGKTSLITSFITFSKPTSASKTMQILSAPESCHFLQLLLPPQNSTVSRIASNTRVSLILTEVAGLSSYELLYPSAIISADAYLLVYDVTDSSSFDKMFDLYKLIVRTKQQYPSKIPIVLVGNKIDTVSAGSAVKQLRPGLVPRQVSTDKARIFAETIGIPNYETTAQAPQSVSIIFKNLISITQSCHYEQTDNTYTSLSPLEYRRLSNGSTAILHQLMTQSRRPSQASVLSKEGTNDPLAEIRNCQQFSRSSFSTVTSSSGGSISLNLTLQPPTPDSIRYQRDIHYKKYLGELAISRGYRRKTNPEFGEKVELVQPMNVKKQQQDSGIFIHETPDINIETRTEPEYIERPVQTALRRTSNAKKHRRSISADNLKLTTFPKEASKLAQSILPVSPSPRTPDIQKNLQDTMDDLDFFLTGEESLLKLGMFGKFDSKSGHKTELDKEYESYNEVDSLSEKDDEDEEEEMVKKENKKEMERKRRSIRNVGLMWDLLQDGDEEEAENK
ncbi:hypothetical protein HK096_006255 [Nowakowskiella sp. JEL0078]|nr:hypothetical protein HK096_006255 [Nowakowskiella sp. JEL0078]